MRRTLKKLVVIVLLTLVSISGVYVYADIKAYSNSYLIDLMKYVELGNANIQLAEAEHILATSKYNESVRLYNESRKQTAIIKNQIDQLNYDNILSTQKIEQQKLIEKHLLQNEYYNVCLELTNKDLLDNELNLLNKQIQIEEEKFNLGDSSQVSVDELYIKKQIVEDSIAISQSNIEMKKNLLNSRLNEPLDVSLDIIYFVPSTVEESNIYNLNSLKSSFKLKNISYLKLNAYIEYYDSLLISLKDCVGENDLAYIVAVSELSKVKADLQVLNQQFDLFIENSYIDYKKSSLTYTTLQASQSVTQEKLSILELKYSTGDISELQYLTDKSLILKDLNNVKIAIVDKIDKQSRLNLIVNGIELNN